MIAVDAVCAVDPRPRCARMSIDRSSSLRSNSSQQSSSQAIPIRVAKTVSVAAIAVPIRRDRLTGIHGVDLGFELLAEGGGEEFLREIAYPLWNLLPRQESNHILRETITIKCQQMILHHRILLLHLLKILVEDLFGDFGGFVVDDLEGLAVV